MVNRRAEWLVPLVVLCAVLATFAHTLAFQFVFDDPMLIVNNPFIQSAANIPRFFTENFWSGVALAQKSYYRPLSLLWLLANWKLFGRNPAGWHATSLLLHVINAVLVYLLALRFLRPRPFAVSAAGAAAVLFALHPIQAEAVSWICCFNDLLACLFVLVSFHAYCNAREAAAVFHPAARGRGTVWYGVSLAGYSAAVLCKEPAALFPLIPLLYELCRLIRPAAAPPAGSSGPDANSELASLRASSPRRRLAFLLPLPYFVIAALYLLLRKHALGSLTTPEARILTWRTEWLTLPSVLCSYLAHLVWPVGLSPFYDSRYHQSFTVSGVALPFFAVMLSAVLLLWAAWRSAAVGIFAGWTLIFLAPTLHIGVLPRGELWHDRYLYLPMAGLSVLAGFGFAALAQRWAAVPRARWALGVSAAVISLAFAALTFHQSLFWENNLTLYTRGVAIAPHNGIAANNLGAVLLGRGQWEEAMAQFQRAIEYSPKLYLAHYDMGVGYYEVGRYSEAEACFKRAIGIVPEDAESHLFLGMTYYHTNRLPLAIESVRKAIALKPNGAGYHFALAVMLKESGDPAGARAEFEEELKRDPNHQPTLEQLRLLGAKAPAPAPKP